MFELRMKKMARIGRTVEKAENPTLQFPSLLFIRLSALPKIFFLENLLYRSTLYIRSSKIRTIRLTGSGKMFVSFDIRSANS